jgi:DNA adenine methylase
MPVTKKRAVQKAKPEALSRADRPKKPVVRARADDVTSPVGNARAKVEATLATTERADSETKPENSERAARPFLKWAGGKGKAVDTLKAFLPAKIRTYHEPMVGGGALFFALAAEGRYQNAQLNDSNQELICSYLAIREDVDGLIALLSTYKYDRTFFNTLRAAELSTIGLVNRGARMIYLNKTGFNGLYRVNKKGQFNVPFGRYDNPLICDEPNLRAVSAVLQGVHILNRDYQYLYAPELTYAVPGDAVYFDPPYVPLSKTANFTAYGADGFGPKEHEELAASFAALAKRGVAVMLSNSDTSFTRELYKDFEIRTVKARRNINKDPTKRGDVSEIVVLANCRT